MLFSSEPLRQPAPIPDLTSVCTGVLDGTRSGVWGLRRPLDLQDGEADSTRYELLDGPAVTCIEDLIGFDVPDSWCGVVIAMSGTATDLVDGTRRSIRFAFSIDRDGRAATLCVDRSGARLALGDGTNVAPTGRLADITHRMFGLPTPPEPTRPVALALLDWIHELIDLATDDDFTGWVDDWASVADLHPLAEIARSISPADLGLAAAHDRATWEDLHRYAAELGMGVAGLSSAEVAWLDGPSMGRWILDSRPPIQVALDAAAQVVPADVLRRVVATIAASDVW